MNVRMNHRGIDRYKKITAIISLLVFLVPCIVDASTTDGTIQSGSNGRARINGTVGGYINFAATNGNVHVTDTALTGYAWAENAGWISLNPANGGVTNNAEGTLGGYAWGEHIGWINFAPTNGGVTINSSGVFSGYAWGERVGWISFNCLTDSTCGSTSYRVVTDWRPQSVRNATPDPGSGGGGGGGGGTGTTTPPNPTPTSTPPVNPPPPVGPPSTPPVFPPPPSGQPPVFIPPPNNPPPVNPVNPPPSNPLIPAVVPGWVGDIVDRGGDIIEPVQRRVSELYAQPTINRATKVITVGSLAISTAAALISIMAASWTLVELLLTPFRLGSLLMGIFGAKKKARPWGTVYDSITKQPLDPAYVVVKNAQGVEVTTSVTDVDGRYGFLLGQGTYTLIARKTNYVFPSRRLAGQRGDVLYDNLYFGEAVTLNRDGGVINKNIPLDPERFDWNEYMKNNRKLMQFYSRRDALLVGISDWFFRIGFGVSLIALFALFEPYNYIIAGIYVVLLILRHIGLRPRTYGTLVDRTTGDPLSFAVIRIISPILGREIVHKVTDQYGRYYCLVPRGTYTVRIEKRNRDESYIVAGEVSLKVTQGIINQAFSV